MRSRNPQMHLARDFWAARPRRARGDGGGVPRRRARVLRAIRHVVRSTEAGQVAAAHLLTREGRHTRVRGCAAAILGCSLRGTSGPSRPAAVRVLGDGAPRSSSRQYLPRLTEGPVGVDLPAGCRCSRAACAKSPKVHGWVTARCGWTVAVCAKSPKVHGFFAARRCNPCAHPCTIALFAPPRPGYPHLRAPHPCTIALLAHETARHPHPAPRTPQCCRPASRHRSVPCDLHSAAAPRAPCTSHPRRHRCTRSAHSACGCTSPHECMLLFTREGMH